MENQQLASNLSWNFSSLFSSDNDPKIQENLDLCLTKAKQFEEDWSARTDYLEDVDVLKQALKEYLEFQENYGSVPAFYYLSLRLEQEQNNSELRAKNAKAEDIVKNISNTIQFFTARLSKVDPSFQQLVLNSPELLEYRHFFFKLFEESKHVLSEEVEKVLTLQSDTSYSNWVAMTDKFLNAQQVKVNIKNTDQEVSFNQLFSLSSDTDKTTRDSAVEQLNQVLEKFSDVAENEINSVLSFRKTIDQLRGYSRPDQARHLGDDVPSEVVDALIAGVSKRFDISHSYYKLKSNLLGQEALAYHERNIPFGNLGKQYSWEESIALVDKVFAKLDPEFSEIFQSMLKNGQFDVYPKAGKSGGAFCTEGAKNVPVYVLLSHANTLNDVLTLAHEMGHAVHHHLFNKNQHSLNRQGSMFTAEVSSTFMEDFVLEEILEYADDELKLAILMNKLNDDTSTIFRQTAGYNFETVLHKSFREKGYLSKQEIGQLFSENMSSYMGKYVSQDEGSQNWWVYWSHIRSYFYVYSYASGLLISKTMQKNYKKDANYIQKIKEFMSAGSSKSSVELFSELGIDITNPSFWSDSVESTQRLLEETIDLAKKLGKI